MRAHPFAKLSIEELPISAIERLEGDTEILALGPLSATMRGGMVAIDGVVVICSDIEGSLSATPIRSGAETCVAVQFDIAHGHQDFRLAGSFKLAVDDFARIVDRLQPILALARLEEARK